MPVKHIHSPQEFYQYINGSPGRIVVVKYSTTWCRPCKIIAPLYEELSNQYPNMVFLHVDLDELQMLSEASSIGSVPTFNFYLNGQVKRSLEGSNQSSLREAVALANY